MVWELLWVLAPLATVCRSDRRGQGRRQVIIAIITTIIIVTPHHRHRHNHHRHHLFTIIVIIVIIISFFFIQTRGRQALVAGSSRFLGHPSSRPHRPCCSHNIVGCHPDLHGGKVVVIIIVIIIMT